jgi:hypothetical protein
MVQSAESYWFTSTLFDVEPGEDEETNPRLYGRQVANWLRDRFLALGYKVEEVIPEDWGWCVMCQRDPYWLFVGCVNLRDYAYAKEGDPPPPKDQLLWNVVPMAELPPFKYLLRRKPNTSAGLARLGADLGGILEAEPSIRIQEASVADNWFKERKRDA